VGDKICLQESGSSCVALRNGGDIPPICGEELAPRLSYKIAVPGWGEIPLDESNDKCDWVYPTTFGVCYGGILLRDGVVKIIESAVAESYLVENGFELYAMVPDYASFNVSKTVSVDPPSSSSSGTYTPPNPPSSSSGETYCQIANACIFVSTWTCSAINGTAVTNCGEGTPTKPPTKSKTKILLSAQYYNLKGEHLGSKKPAKVGVYIVRQNGASRVMVVRE